MSQPFRVLLASVVLAATGSNGIAAETTESLLKTIKAVGSRGEGNVAAAQAQRALSQVAADKLPAILQAFEGAGPLASNWLRGAVESIADRAINSGKKLPENQLTLFIINREQVPRARRLAFELLQRVAPDNAEKLVPGMLDDPSPELRREAVARLIDEAKKTAARQKTRRRHRGLPEGTQRRCRR